MAKKKGNQKPTTSYVLKYVKKNSKGMEAAELYNKTGQTAMKWQVSMLKDIMAVGKNDLWIHTKCGYSLPRRNGKSEILNMRELWGLFHGERILHTAHRVSTEHASWEKMVRLLTKLGYKYGEDYNAAKAKGQEYISFKDNGSIEFRTRTTCGGLGEGFDLLVIDEAQEYTDDQESALKYTVSDSSHPQTIMCGTPPTAYSKGTVFLKFRNQTLKGERKRSYWVEWGVEKESDVHDASLWYLCNPSMGYHLTEEDVEDEIGDDLMDFQIQRLGLWIQYSQQSAVTLKDWDALKTTTMPALKGRLFAGIKYGKDGQNVALSIAVKTAEGKTFVETIGCHPIRDGNDWILSFLKQADVQSVIIDGANGQSILAAEMKDARIKIRPLLPKVVQVVEANAYFEKSLYNGSICHAGQVSLTDSVTNCEKRAIGTNGGFGYKSLKDTIDISLMDSMILANWACGTAKPVKKQMVGY